MLFCCHLEMKALKVLSARREGYKTPDNAGLDSRSWFSGADREKFGRHF